MTKKTVTVKDVEYIASLSRIHLEKDELAHLTQDLSAILDYVQKLEKLKVKDVSPTSHVLPLHNVYREDEIKPSLPQDKALSIAVEKSHGSFVVPKVIEWNLTNLQLMKS